MKKAILIKAIATVMFAIPLITAGQAVTKEFETEPFTGVSAGGVFTVSLTQAEEFSVKVETTEDQLDKVSVDVKRNVLTLSFDGSIFRRAERINVYVTAPVYEKIIAGGDAAINGTNKFTSPELELTASGSSDVRLNLETENLHSRISGAANATLRGIATLHETEVSGAAYLKAYELQTEKTVATGSGASSLQVNASEELQLVASGTSSINYQQVPKSQSISTSGAGSIHFKGDPADLDETSVKAKDQKDTVRVKVGERDLLIVSDEESRRKKTVTRRRSFRSNWSGIEMGVNGYLTPEHSINLSADDYYLELDYARSLSVNINCYQQNFNLIKNNVGLFTGFGFGFINYAFDNNITLLHEANEIDYVTEDHGFKRNRLSMVNFNIPVMLEYQTARTRKIEQFHLSAGVIGSAKLRSYTKQVYDFEGEKQKDKFTKSYHTRPFNLDATVRVGWGRVNLFATYSLFPLFRSDKGPELHPFNVGIRLVNW